MADIKLPHNAFTVKNNGRVNRLISKASLMSKEVIALWDTGATGTCISEEIAQELSLTPSGKEIINTPAGQKEVSTYLVDIKLPNNVHINSIKVRDSDIGKQKIDMLIGMDIITLGDFSVSNFNGKTTFSFCFPSKKEIDFVKQFNYEKVIGQKHGKGNKKKHKK